MRSLQCDEKWIRSMAWPSDRSSSRIIGSRERRKNIIRYLWGNRNIYSWSIGSEEGASFSDIHHQAPYLPQTTIFSAKLPTVYYDILEMFYQGSLQDGINLALNEAKAVICFVRGPVAISLSAVVFVTYWCDWLLDDTDVCLQWEKDYFGGNEV